MFTCADSVLFDTFGLATTALRGCLLAGFAEAAALGVFVFTRFERRTAIVVALALGGI